MFSLFKIFQKPNRESGELGEVSQTKRWFFKGMATAGFAMSALGGWMGAHAESRERKDCQAAYDEDVLPGDKILQQNGFEEIPREEVQELVQMFVDDYDKKRQA